MPNALNIILDKFDSIALKEMDSVQLMNRVDTKFAFTSKQLIDFLPKLAEFYYVLEINDVRISTYESLYFDDKVFSFYNDHHRQKSSRYKIRIRKYVESNISFLEIKHKVNGRTHKSRIPTNSLNETLTEDQQTFVKNTGIDKDLIPSLINNFSRITLVNKNMNERLTFDLDLTFKWEGKQHTVDNIIIAELKQGKANRSSAFYKIMKSDQIRPLKVSKYCLGVISLYGKKKIKYNRFKKKLLIISKLQKNVA